MFSNNSIIFLLFLIFISCQDKQSDSTPRTVEIREKGGQYQLIRHEEPYYIKGASGFVRMEKIKEYGGNSIRTWSTHNGKAILDEAESFGLTVTLGLEVGRQWWGKDFNYWNFKKVDQKINDLRKVIEQFKDHPALLMWGVGNEVHLHGGNKYLILYIINRIAKMIHEIDPNHPVMTTIEAGPNLAKYGYMRILLSEIDLLGFNSFGSLPRVSDGIKSPTGWNKPYFISEWGPLGPWERERTEWDAPLELSNIEKANFMNTHWNIIEKDSIFCFGGYAFYWGHKHEGTQTWFSLFSKEGFETESVNILQKKWSGKLPDNWAPRIDSLLIKSMFKKNNLYLDADSIYPAQVYAQDPDNDPLTFQWELRPEEAVLYETESEKYNMPHLLFSENCSTIQFRTPKKEGGYRIFVFVYDGKQHVASHNIPFYVVIK